VSKKKREHERKYNEKTRQREYDYDKYRTMTDNRESTNNGEDYNGWDIISLCALFGNVAMHLDLHFISLCIQFDNVAMYQNYIHREICPINTSNILKNIF